MIRRSLLVLTVLALALPTAARAHDVPGVAPETATIQAEFNASLLDAETKIMDLAEATPEGKYGWAPAKGVRSMSEVFMHVASANYFLPTFFGVAAPTGVDASKLEAEVKDKATAIKTLKASFAAAHAAIDATTDHETKIKMFGMDMTKRYAMMVLVTHAHEHLGQAIAYARSNGITPPWTARQEAAEAEAKAKQGKTGKTK